MTNSSAYNKLAFIYSHVMRRVKYDYWAEYIHSITKESVKENPLVLELAGGNCSLANNLAGYYPNIVVTDYSREMLFSDKEKKLPRVCCDMSLLPFKRRFDFIYSTFDSVNYLTSKKKLFNLFCEIRRVLADRGIFTFDVSLERNSFIHVQQPVRKGKYNNINYIHHTIYDEKKKIHKNIFEIKFADGSAFKEIHRQKIYQFEDYFKLIEKAGLYVVDCYEGFTFKDASPSSVRAQFVVARSGKD
ncbi:MAG: methyltransferase domain-containing protein [Ignavibacteriaceae bacterium]